MLRSELVVVLVGFFVGRSKEGVTKGSTTSSKSDGDTGSATWPESGVDSESVGDSGIDTWTKSVGDNGSATWPKSGGDRGSAAWSKYGGKGGSATWPKSGGAGGFSAWPKEPEIVNDYEAKGQFIELDATMQAYKIGSGSKMVVWSHDIFGLTGEKSDNGRTKEWADFLAENGYNVLVPDWYRGNNLPGGTFGPSTPAWSASVTNWTKIESDWTNVILPYLQKESPSSIGMIGTCWGSYPVVRLSMFDTISAGVSMHPSHPILMGTAGDDEAEVLGLIKSPQLFLVEGGAVDSLKTGGLAEEVLGDKLTVVEFPDMKHGWTVRGNLEDPDVARDVKKAKKLVLDFLGEILK